MCQRSLSPAESRGKEQGGVLSSALSKVEETEVLGWMRCFRQVFPVMVIDSLSLSRGGDLSLPLPSLLSTLVVWQGRSHC